MRYAGDTTLLNKSEISNKDNDKYTWRFLGRKEF
jgi:hypothetical protein